MKKPFSILFVCTGNICRSPTAEAVFRHRIREAGLENEFRHDSAGTHGYHEGEAPDQRSIAHLKKRGIDMGDLRARKVRPEDYYAYDLILAMDGTHLQALKSRRPKDATAEVALYLAYAHARKGGDVADPYYKDAAAFERVIAEVNDATEALLARFRQGNLL